MAKWTRVTPRENRVTPGRTFPPKWPPVGYPPPDPSLGRHLVGDLQDLVSLPQPKWPPRTSHITNDVLAAGGGETYMRFDSDIELGDTHMNDSIPGVKFGDVEGVDVVTYQGKLVRKWVGGKWVNVKDIPPAAGA